VSGAQIRVILMTIG